MDIRFWGVRGSIAVSGARYLRSGGNTTCVEVRHQGERLILDGGTGLRALGASLGFGPQRATLLFTHVHWDHIQGVPFFGPAFNPASQLTLGGVNLREALGAQMQPPQFPITLAALRAQLSWLDVRPGSAFDVGPFHVIPFRGEHPDGVLAYRIEAGGRAFVFCTDQEHGGRIERDLVHFAEGADLLVHDAQYTVPEYRGQVGPPRKGWGHSTWAEAVEVGRRAGVARLGLFHHDPDRDDDALAVIEAEARGEFAPSFACREGEVLAL